MTEAVPAARPLDAASLAALRATSALWEAHAAAAEARAAHAGGMVWRPGRLGERLVRLSPATRTDGRRRETDLGARGPETEALRAAYEAGRAAAAADEARTAEALAAQAGTNKALGLGTLPRAAGAILRGLALEGLLGTAAVVVGPALLHAYESAAGLRLGRSARDPSAESDTLLTLLALGDPGPVSEAARRVDPSLRHGAMPGMMTDRNGYGVMVLRPGAAPGWESDPTGFSGVAVDVSGMPAPMAGPTPRSFVASRLRRAGEGRGDEGALEATLQARAAVACLAPDQRGDRPGSRRVASP